MPKDFHAKAVHVAPIANEISYETVEHLKNCADILSLDPQGLLRSFDEAGNVAENAAVDNRILGLINIYKSSQNEIYALTGETELKPAIKAIHDFGVETVIVTNGRQRLRALSRRRTIQHCRLPLTGYCGPNRRRRRVHRRFLNRVSPAKRIPLVRRCWFRRGFVSLLKGWVPLTLGKKEEIYRRANVLYEKELKQ